MAAGDLTTLASAKAWLSVSGQTDDAVLTRLVSAASGFLQTYLNRTIAQAAYTEVRNGKGTPRMTVANYPIVSVQSLSVDGIPIPASTVWPQNGYLFDRNEIMVFNYAFTRGFQNVAMAYTAGFAIVPLDIEQGCLELIGLRYRERDRIGYSSKSIAGETVAFMVKDMSESTRTLLQNYRKVTPV